MVKIITLQTVTINLSNEEIREDLENSPDFTYKILKIEEKED